jgi:hypothetical protein
MLKRKQSRSRKEHRNFGGTLETEPKRYAALTEPEPQIMTGIRYTLFPQNKKRLLVLLYKNFMYMC